MCLHSPDGGLLNQQSKFSCNNFFLSESFISFSYFLWPSQTTYCPSVAEETPAVTFVLLKFDNLNPRLIYAFCMKKNPQYSLENNDF